MGEIVTAKEWAKLEIESSEWSGEVVKRAKFSDWSVGGYSGRAQRRAHPLEPKKARMSEEPVTREELKLHVDLLEQKSERRADALGNKIDRLSEVVENLAKGVADSTRETKKDNNATRVTVVTVVVASALAVLGLVAAIQGTMTTANGNVLSALQAGLAVQASQAPSPPPAQPTKK